MRERGAYVIESVRSGRGVWVGETNVPQFRNTRNACEIVHGLVGRVFLNTMRISLKVPLAHQRAPSPSRVRGGRDIKEVLDHR